MLFVNVLHSLNRGNEACNYILLFIAIQISRNWEKSRERGKGRIRRKRRSGKEKCTQRICHYIYNKRVENNKFLSMMLSCELLCNMHELLKRKSMICTSYKVSSYFCIWIGLPITKDNFLRIFSHFHEVCVTELVEIDWNCHKVYNSFSAVIFNAETRKCVNQFNFTINLARIENEASWNKEQISTILSQL